jgi:hypothetical protein
MFPEKKHSTSLLGFVSLFLFVAVGAAAAPVAVVSEGDAVGGVGNVFRIDNLAVNNAGEWLVEADTDHADTNLDQVLLGPGGLVLREGDGLADPAGSSLDSFDSINLNESGDSGWNFFLDGTSGTGDDSGIYFNTTLVIQESDVSTAAAFSPGTPYIGFFDAKINDSDQMAIVASVDDPAIPSSVDQAIVRIDIDGAGNLLAETVVAKEGDALAGQTETVTTFGTGPHQSAFNDAGSVLYFADLTGDTSMDGVIYLDGTLVAQERSPSPAGGRLYELLSSRSLDVNNAGGHVFKANLAGDTTDDEIIVANGAIVAQEGDSPAAIAPFLLTGFGTGSGPVRIADDGSVLWFGDWDDPDTDRDTGLFLDDTLIVQEGVTTIGGVILDTIASGQDAFALSDNGQWVIFEGVLVNGIEAAFLLEVDPPTEVVTTELRPAARLTASPNPFRGRTNVSYSLDAPGEVELTVYDVTGRLVRTLASGAQGAGEHRTSWTGLDTAGRRLPAGVYFVRLRAAGSVAQTKVVRVD